MQVSGSMIGGAASVMLALVLSCTAAAVEVHRHDLPEVRAPDGSAAVAALVVLADGRSAAMLISEGQWSVMRFDAQGNETSRWIPPGLESTYIPANLALRESDGAVGFVTRTGNGAGSLVWLALNGQEIARVPLLTPGAVPGELRVLPEGYGVTSAVPFALQGLHASGATRDLYLPATPIDYPQGASRWLADGGFVSVESTTQNGEPPQIEIRRLDTTLKQVWSRDPVTLFPPSGGPITRIIDGGNGGTMVLSSSVGLQAALVLLDAQGGVLSRVNLPAAVPNMFSSLYINGHATATGYSVLGVYRPSFLESCRYEATISWSGVLSESCSSDAGTSLSIVAERNHPGGSDALFYVAGNGDPHFELRSKLGSQPSTGRALRGALLSSTLNPVTALRAESTSMVLSDGIARRLLRWDAGERPALEVLLPAADPSHRPSDVLVDSEEAVVFAVNSVHHSEIVRIKSDGAETRWVGPEDRASAGQVIEATDGSFRLLSEATPARVKAVTRAGQHAWTHAIPTAYGPGFIEALQDGATLVGYAPVDESGCRVRRLDSAGNDTGDLALGVPGRPIGSVRSGSGVIVLCHASSGDRLAHVAPDLSVTLLPASTCAVGQPRLAAVGEARWVLAGFRPMAFGTLRFCTFDGTTFVHERNLAFTQGDDLRFEPHWLRPDPSSGKIHLAFTRLRSGHPDDLVHVAYDAGANTITMNPLHATGDRGALVDFAGPDHRGRLAFLYAGMPDGAPTRIEFGRPGQLPRWTAAVDLPTNSIRLAWAAQRVSFGAAEAKAFSQTVLTVGQIVPDNLFDAGFETPGE